MRVTKFLEETEVDVIVHVGAHKGLELEEYIGLDPQVIVMIEADPEIYQLLLENAARIQPQSGPKILCLNALVADQDGISVPFYHFNNNGQSSSIYRSTPLLEDHWSNIGLGESGRVLDLVSHRLDTLLDDLGLSEERISALVIDVQGAEYKTLLGAGKYLKSCMYIQVEVSKDEIYKDAPTFKHLNYLLTQLGFELKTGVPWHGDAVYTKNQIPEKFYKVNESCQIPFLEELYETYFGRITSGTFVEVGAYDGELVSNTSCLADAGWRGLYIEPHPDYASACANRHTNNRVTVIQCAVGQPGNVVLHVGGYLSTIKEGHVEAYKNINWARGKHRGEQIEVESESLDHLMNKADIPGGFDLLVVDVEGAEPEVFDSFDLNKWQPKMLIVELEDNHQSFQEYEEILEPIRVLRQKIQASGYSEFWSDDINTIFLRDDTIN